MNTLLIIISVILAALLAVATIAYLKDKSLDEIRVEVYKLFKQAKEYKESSTGKQKMKWVVNQARKLLPPWIQIFVTEMAFENLLQIWFEEIEDLLDDGKSNDSNKGV